MTAVTAIPPLEHDEAMALAEAELDRLLAVVDSLDGHDWTRPTDCTGWTVRDMLGHLLGMFALQADPEERTRQIKTAAELAAAPARARHPCHVLAAALTPVITGSARFRPNLAASCTERDQGGGRSHVGGDRRAPARPAPRCRSAWRSRSSIRTTGTSRGTPAAAPPPGV